MREREPVLKRGTEVMTQRCKKTTKKCDIKNE